MKDGLPVILFETKKHWSDWLEINYNNSVGIWMRIAKKKADLKSVTYEEALDVALCYGWIDGQKYAFDEHSWLQRFTPRKKRSNWSNVNIEKAFKLISDGEMKPSGFVAIEVAKRSGLWDRGYDSQRKIKIPADFKSELKKNLSAFAFFERLDSRNRYAILRRIQIATNDQIRSKRINEFIKMLSENRKLYT